MVNIPMAVIPMIAIGKFNIPATIPAKQIVLADKNNNSVLTITYSLAHRFGESPNPSSTLSSGLLSQLWLSIAS